MESKDYERHSETIIIPPAHVALRCDNRLPIRGLRMYIILRLLIPHLLGLAL
jgi:hypothetical protein